MKKIICVILSLLLLFSFATTAVSAEDWGENFYLAYHYFGTNNGYDICAIDALFTIMAREEVIGGYLFLSSCLSLNEPDEQMALYAVRGDEQFNIKDAYEQGLIDIGAVAEMVDGFIYNSNPFYWAFPLGDTNYNKKLEVADTILIQRFIAKIDSWPNHYNLYDVNQDGEINLEDVLLVQKKIAKIVPY